ncbi:MAG: hypothetical protein RLN60_02875 [Phycisphaerales bacterium]
MHSFRSAIACLALAAVPAIASAGDVRSYTRSIELSRSEGLISTRDFVPAADIRDGRLVEAIPYPVNRTDDPARLENGRLWVPRAPIGSRTIINELTYGFPGAAGVGAAPGENERVIFVRSETGLPNIAISPFQTIDDSTFDLIEEQIPFIGNTRTRTELRRDEVIAELREAQSQWLREHGYIQKVRTHVNPNALYGRADEAMGARGASTIEPRAIIRTRPAMESLNAELPDAETPRVIRIGTPVELNEGSVVRVSVNTEQATEVADASEDQSPE